MARTKEEDFHAEGIYFDEKSEQYSRTLKMLDPNEYAPELQGQIEDINQYLESVADSFEDLQNRIELMEYTNESGIWSMKYDESGKRTDLAWSDGVRHLLGYESKEDFPDVFQSWVDVLTPEMASTAAEVFDSVAAFEGSPALTRFDYPMRRKDGEWHWYHSTGKISRRPDGTIKEYIGTYRDITAEHNKDIYISQLKTIGLMFDFMTYIDLEITALFSSRPMIRSNSTDRSSHQISLRALMISQTGRSHRNFEKRRRASMIRIPCRRGFRKQEEHPLRSTMTM